MQAGKIGRPTRAPKRGERRVSLGLRVTADIKRRLDAAAAKNGRSQSQEAELRIERSFRVDHEEAAYGGPELRWIATRMAVGFANAGQMWARGRAPAEWIGDAHAYWSAVSGVIETLLNGAPDTDPDTIQLQLDSLKGRLMSHAMSRQHAAKAGEEPS